jgi:hypothetical protein
MWTKFERCKNLRGIKLKAYQFYKLFKIKKSLKKMNQIWRINKLKGCSWIFKILAQKSKWGEREEGRKKK